jgi:hypothetical protein
MRRWPSSTRRLTASATATDLRGPVPASDVLTRRPNRRESRHRLAGKPFQHFPRRAHHHPRVRRRLFDKPCHPLRVHAQILQTLVLRTWHCAPTPQAGAADQRGNRICLAFSYSRIPTRSPADVTLPASWAKSAVCRPTPCFSSSPSFSKTSSAPCTLRGLTPSSLPPDGPAPACVPANGHAQFLTQMRRHLRGDGECFQGGHRGILGMNPRPTRTKAEGGIK